MLQVRNNVPSGVRGYRTCAEPETRSCCPALRRGRKIRPRNTTSGKAQAIRIMIALSNILHTKERTERERPGNLGNRMTRYESNEQQTIWMKRKQRAVVQVSFHSCPEQYREASASHTMERMNGRVQEKLEIWAALKSSVGIHCRTATIAFCATHALDGRRSPDIC